MLTAQQLACGYIDSYTLSGITTVLWHEHGIYHVRTYNHNTQTRLVWNTFKRKVEAYWEYNTQVRQVKSGKLY